MTTSIVKCRIAVGKNAYLPYAKMNGLGNRLGSVSNTPWSFRCNTCKQVYGEMSTTSDLCTVSCSNCYSDDMFLTEIQINVPDDWEVNGGVRPT